MSKLKNSPEEQVKKSLLKAGTDAKKYLGQHFLIDESLLPVIIQAAELNNHDTVIEIGPGLGVLTRELINNAGHVTAVEVDHKLASGLSRRFTNQKNLTVINKDILDTIPDEILKGVTQYKVVANLPYNITSPVLSYFTDTPYKPVLMVVMIQREVAEAIVARSGNLTVLAIRMQLLTHPSIIRYVPAASFYPAPKVESAIIRLNFLEKPAISVDSTDLFMKFVKKSFHSPRKTIHNSLALGFKLEGAIAGALLGKAGIEKQKRPGELTLSQWESLYSLAKKMNVILL